jgi:hypothetical protein
VPVRPSSGSTGESPAADRRDRCYGARKTSRKPPRRQCRIGATLPPNPLRGRRLARTRHLSSRPGWCPGPAAQVARSNVSPRRLAGEGETATGRPSRRPAIRNRRARGRCGSARRHCSVSGRPGHPRFHAVKMTRAGMRTLGRGRGMPPTFGVFPVVSFAPSFAIRGLGAPVSRRPGEGWCDARASTIWAWPERV